MFNEQFNIKVPVVTAVKDDVDIFILKGVVVIY